MPDKNRGFINVDELVPQVTIEQVAAYYGVPLPELKRVGEETRTRCFLNCGKTQDTGDRALAIQESHPARQWQCHQYGCDEGRQPCRPDGPAEARRQHGRPPAGRPFQANRRRPAGDRRRFAVDGNAAAGTGGGGSPTRRYEMCRSPKATTNGPEVSRISTRSSSPIRRLMPPAAASYFRRRPFLLSEECQKQWRFGYLPRDVGGEDKSGGTMRGKIVYAYKDEEGNLLTWFGRDPEFEEKHRTWEAAGRGDREPEKFHFVKGFHRGLEVFGQNGRERLDESGYREKLKQFGLIIVEGPNDVIALDCLGVPAVGLCSNTATDEQVEKIAQWADDLADGLVTLMLDCDPEGENGAKQVLWKVAQRCRVRLAWSSEMYGGDFKGWQPEMLGKEHVAKLRIFNSAVRSRFA